MLGHLAQKYGLPLVFVNQVGATTTSSSTAAAALSMRRAACSAGRKVSKQIWWWWTCRRSAYAPDAIAEDDFEPEAEIWSALVAGRPGLRA